MADVKVPALLHKMSVSSQKAWYNKHNMALPGHLTGGEGKSAAQAKKDVGEINKAKANRLKMIAAAAKKVVQPMHMQPSSERVRAMRQNADQFGGGLGGGLDRNRDIMSYVRSGGYIKAGRLGEETSLDEARVNHREFATAGIMHPDMAHSSRMKTGNMTDFYSRKNGDKLHGKILSNDNKTVRIEHEGKVHKFDVRRSMPISMYKEEKDDREYGYEGDMAMSQLKSIIANSQKMHDMLEPDTDLPEWVQSKITLAEDYIVTAANYLQGEMNEESVKVFAKEEQTEMKDSTTMIEAKRILGLLRKEEVEAGMQYIEERLKSSDPAAKWIQDFVKSDNPKFKGKSKEERIRMALGAKYASKRRAEGVAEEVEQIDELSRGTLKAYVKAANQSINDIHNRNQPKPTGKIEIDPKSGHIEKVYTKKTLSDKDREAWYKRDGNVERAKQKLNRTSQRVKVKATGEPTLSAKRQNNEQVEQIDELKASTLGSYMAKSTADEKARREKGVAFSKELSAQTGMRFATPFDPKIHSKNASRSANRAVAIKKLTGQAKVNANEAMDPVGREDNDVNNDGKADKTDVYLSKRRKAVGSAIKNAVSRKMGK
jgi:hypothetical protein